MSHNALQSNRTLYEMLVRDIERLSLSASNESKAQKVSQVAKFAMMNFTGLLSDYRIEKILIEIGKELDANLISTKNQAISDTRNVLHVVSKLFNTGGHTKIVRNWIEMDTRSVSSLVVTDQDTFLEFGVHNELVKNCHEVVFLNAKDSLVERSLALKKYILSTKFDVIVLHHHPDDVIPVIALSNENFPPVMHYNHADHLFGIGVAISDLVIHFRKISHDFSLRFRGVKRSEVLSYPLKSVPDVGHDVVKKNSKVTFITMGSLYKFMPYQGHNLFKLFASILNKYPECELLVIGVSEKSCKERFGINPPQNMRFLGEVIDPNNYLNSADFFIEPYPVGTGLGTVESLQHGLIPIFNYFDVTIYGRGARSLFSNELFIQELNTQAEYEDLIIGLITKEYTQRKEQIKRFEDFLNKCRNPEWLASLESLYSLIESNEHTVKAFSGLALIDTHSTYWAEYYSNKYVNKLKFVLNVVFKLKLADKLYLIKLLFRNHGFEIFYSYRLTQIFFSVLIK